MNGHTAGPGHHYRSGSSSSSASPYSAGDRSASLSGVNASRSG